MNRKRLKKSLLLFLAVIFIISCVPVSAEDEIFDNNTQEELAPSINLAYLKPVTASSQRDNFVFVCNAVNDGNLIQRWEPGELPCWIIIDLQEKLSFNELCIYTIGSADDYVISGSDDGETWFKITDHNASGAIPSGDFSFSLAVNATCRYVKFEVNESDMSEEFGVYEMEIRAPAEQKDDNTDPTQPTDVDKDGPEILYPLYPRDTAENRENIRHLEKLGILEGYDDETFRGNREVSRGEFIKGAVKLLNLSLIRSDQTLFADVPENHAYFQYINTAADYGIISGDGSGNFRPDDTITAAEAVKIMVETLGYRSLAVSKGGYPSGYFMVANQLKLLRNFPQEGKITRFHLANILSRAMNTKMASISGIDGGDASFSDDETVLERCFDIYKDEGVVYVDEFSSFDGKDKTGSGIKINGEVYQTEEYFPALFLGNKVEFYYKDGYILSAEQSGKTVVTEIDRDDIDSLSDSSVTYELDGKTEHISFSNDLTIVYNGSVLTAYDNDQLIPQYGKIRCMDWDGDGECEVLYLDEAVHLKTGVVTSDTVVDADMTDFRMRIAGDKRYRVFQDGQMIGMPPEDSVLTVFADRYISKNGLKLPDTDRMKVCRIEVSQKRIDGTIDAVLHGDNIVSVGEKEYRYIKTLEPKLKPGKSMVLFLDSFGTVCYAGEEGAPSETYVYFIGVSSAVGLKAPQLKFFDQKAISISDMEQKVKINGSATSDVVSSMKKAGLLDASGESISQLIKIRKNSEGKISSIVTAQEGTDFALSVDAKDTKLTFFRPAGAGYSFFRFMLDENAKIFQVPKNVQDADDKDYKMFSAIDLTHRKQYYVQAYNMDDLRLSNLAVIYKPKGETQSTSHSQAVCVVNGMVKTLNEEGETEQKLEYYQNGALCIRSIATEGLEATLQKYSRGDILLLAYNDENEIAGSREVFLHKSGEITKFGDLNNANSYLLPAFGKVIKAENNHFLLDRTSGLPSGDTTSERILPYYAGSAVCLVYDCENNQLKKGTVSDMLAAEESDALFVRGNMSAPKEMILYKGYYS